MRKIVEVVIWLSAIMLAGCSKNEAVTPAALAGKWQLLSDDTYQGIGSTNHLVHYNGQATDYFDFRTDGKLYIKENGLPDTLSYVQMVDTAVIISSFGPLVNGVPAPSRITTLTLHPATIVSPVLYTPGGMMGRTVILNR